MVRLLSSRARETLHLQLAWLLVLVAFAYPGGWASVDFLAPQTTQSDTKSDTDDEASKEVGASKIPAGSRLSSRQLLKTQRHTQRIHGSPECVRAPDFSRSRPSPRLDALVGSGIRQHC
jgi:hypothetical protein